MDRLSYETGFLPFSVTFTFLRYVFIDTSTPIVDENAHQIIDNTHHLVMALLALF
jgi:hypothetical protein